MSQYATVERVKANIPSKRSEAVDDDSEIRIEIEQASAWVDSLYKEIAPFPSIGNGTFTELFVASDSITGTQVSIESAPASLETGMELMFGTRLGELEGEVVDYSVYSIAAGVEENDESITLNREFFAEGAQLGQERRSILIGTPTSY